MNQAIITSLARHILTATAGAFLLKYGIDGTTIDAIVGGLSALIGVGWSIFEKTTQEKK